MIRLRAARAAVVGLYRDIPWCHWRRPHRPDAVGQVLIFYAVLFVCYGIGLMLGTQPTNRIAGLKLAIEFAPLPAWGCLFLAAAVVCVGSSILIGEDPGAVGFSAAWMPCLGWTCWYIAGILDGAPLTGLITAIIWATFGGLAFRVSSLIDSRRITRQVRR